MLQAVLCSTRSAVINTDDAIPVIAPTTPNCSLDIGTCTVNGHVIVCCCDVDLANIVPDVIIDDGSTLMLCYVCYAMSTALPT